LLLYAKNEGIFPGKNFGFFSAASKAVTGKVESISEITVGQSAAGALFIFVESAARIS
jgi:hypothetical protein